MIFKGAKGKRGEFPGSPVVRTLHSHCRGPRFNPWLGTKVLQDVRHGQKKKEKKEKNLKTNQPNKQTKGQRGQSFGGIGTVASTQTRTLKELHSYGREWGSRKICPASIGR